MKKQDTTTGVKPLTAEDLVIGNKYVPLRKSVGDKFKHSDTWHKHGGKKQGFLYYNGSYRDDDAGNVHLFSNEKSKSGDYYIPSDVIPYVEPDTVEGFTGGWEVSEYNDGKFNYYSIVDKEGNIIAEFGKVGNLESLADATLAAQAPALKKERDAMYQALKKVGLAYFNNGANGENIDGQKVTQLEVPTKDMSELLALLNNIQK